MCLLIAKYFSSFSDNILNACFTYDKLKPHRSVREWVMMVNGWYLYENRKAVGSNVLVNGATLTQQLRF